MTFHSTASAFTGGLISAQDPLQLVSSLFIGWNLVQMFRL